MLLTDGAQCLAANYVKGAVPAGDLDQQRVVIGRDGRAGVGVAAVQTYTEATARAVGGDTADVGREVVGRILGGDAALDGVAVHAQVGLIAHADFGHGQRCALRDENLCAHEVNAGDHLGDRVLNLNSGVHLDEIVVALLVHQKFHRTGRDIADMTGNLDGILVQSLTGCLGYRPGRRELDDLLVAALERAVALAEVDDVAVLVAQHLYFDVLGLNQVLLDEDILIAERLLGLALDALERGSDLFRSVTAPHAAAAAATGCLEDDRETERDCLFERFVCVAQRLGGTGNGGDTAGLCMALAVSLSPIWERMCDGGPMKVIPASSQARAKSAFSLKKP